MALAIGVPVVTVFVVLAVLIGALGAILPGSGDATCQTAPGRTAQDDIPPAYLALYLKAAAQYGIPWNVLAAIGDAESDHGQGTEPGITSGTNHAGAAGPMQFLRSTWAAFGVDGNGDGRKDIYDPADAIPAAARYLGHNGAPAHLERALYQYNHAGWYVKKILRRAAEYGEGGGAPSCSDVPIAATGRAAVAVKAALRWLGTPYSWGGGDLNGPTRGIAQGAGTVGFDCSGLTRHAWHQAGITIPRLSQDQWRTLPHVPAGHEQPGDLVFFRGSGGTSSSPGHVGLVIGDGRMVEAPHTGLKVRISSIRNRSDLVGYARPTPRRF